MIIITIIDVVAVVLLRMIALFFVDYSHAVQIILSCRDGIEDDDDDGDDDDGNGDGGDDGNGYGADYWRAILLTQC